MIFSDHLTYTELFKLLIPVEEKLRRKINPLFYSTGEWQQKQNAGNHFVSQLINKQKYF